MKASISAQHQGSRIKGFTLIELMVVMAIMSVAFSLIGPNLMKVYEKAKYQSESIELREILKRISNKAFLNGRAVSLEFFENQMQYQ